MHKKAMNKDALNQMFEKYAYIPNINEFTFLGKISKAKTGNGLSNPYYRLIRPRTEGVQPFETARVMIEIPSPFRVGEGNKSYISKFPVFTTDESVTKFKDVLSKEGVEYIAGVGKIQDYEVVQKSKPSAELMNFLRELIVDRMNEREEKILGAARILNVLVDDKSKINVKLSTIWSNNISDGTSIAQEKIDEGHLPEKNRVRIQGLIHMPPSIRQSNGQKGNYLHIKVRVKRQKEIPTQNVPIMYQSDYDFINAIAFGDKALEWAEKTEQGHPVYIEGRLESSKFRKYRQVLPDQKSKLASYFGVDESSPYIQMIVQYFLTHKELYEYPNYNIWIDTLETDESKMFNK